MGADEEGTLERLKAHRRQLIDPKIAEHRGRIVKTTGDGLLVEFASVVDAVRCAAEVQRGMLDREPELPDERRIRFRGPRNRARSIAVPHTRSVSGWPLDTNVVSAFGPERRPIPAHTAARFRARTEALYLSTISAAEIEGRNRKTAPNWLGPACGQSASVVRPDPHRLCGSASEIRSCHAEDRWRARRLSSGGGAASRLCRCRDRGDRQVAGAGGRDLEFTPLRPDRRRHFQSIRTGLSCSTRMSQSRIYGV